MKQVERKDSPQRLLCELLASHPKSTIAELSALRRVHERAIARQVDALVRDGYVAAKGRPRRYERTAKPLPDAITPTPRSRSTMRCRSRGQRAVVAATFGIPAIGELERVMSSWAGA